MEDENKRLEHYAKPAPKVEAAVADKYYIDDNEKVTADAAVPSEDVKVEPARAVEPATTNPNLHIATKVQVSNLSVKSLREEQRKFTKDNYFESEAAVIQGKPTKSFLRKALPIVFEERDFVAYGEVQRYIFIKDGYWCLVYLEETDPSPLYVFELYQYYAILEDPKKLDPNSYTISPRVATNQARKDLVTVLLKDRATRKKQLYQISFDTAKLGRNPALEFINLVNNAHPMEAMAVAVNNNNINKNSKNNKNGRNK